MSRALVDFLSLEVLIDREVLAGGCAWLTFHSIRFYEPFASWARAERI